MRIRTGHKPEDWTESVESYARLSGVTGVRGTLVSGEPGPNDKVRQRDYQRKHVAKKAEAA